MLRDGVFLNESGASSSEVSESDDKKANSGSMTGWLRVSWSLSRASTRPRRSGDSTARRMGLDGRSLSSAEPL